MVDVLPLLLDHPRFLQVLYGLHDDQMSAETAGHDGPQSTLVPRKLGVVDVCSGVGEVCGSRAVRTFVVRTPDPGTGHPWHDRCTRRSKGGAARI